MKRILLEWGLIGAVGMTLALATLWAVSRFVDRSTHHFRIPTSNSVGDALHVLVGDGDLALCDQFDVDAAGNVRPLVIGSQQVVAPDIAGGARRGQFTIPGFDLRYYRIARDGYVIWSLRVSLLILVVLSLLLAAWFRRRLRRLRRRLEQGRDGAPRDADPVGPGTPGATVVDRNRCSVPAFPSPSERP